MENKTPGLTKLIVIFEPLILVGSLITFYFLRGRMALPGILWLWFALIIFSSASFLFFLIVFIIALSKRSLRATYWAPFLIVPCITFLVLTILMFVIPQTTQSQSIRGVETEEFVKGVKTEEPSGIKLYEVGELIELGDLIITVNSVRTIEKEEYEMLDEGYIFLLIDISLENTGIQELNISTYSNFRLVDKNGRNYKTAWSEKAKGSIEGWLGAGRKIAGELCYGIPADTKEFELEISDPNPETFKTEIVVININLNDLINIDFESEETQKDLLEIEEITDEPGEDLDESGAEEINELTLYDGDSYHFLSGARDKYTGGDFYFSFSEIGPSFWANNLYQRGLLDLGNIGEVDLNEVIIPDEGYYEFGVKAIAGHTYVSLAQEGEGGRFIVFRVLEIETDSFVKLEYVYR